ncbi:hypothetical protein MPSEU_000458200 [Mayamaea pseudoterrestris]|nr:hypothetical protein MPSEU_000458200 [Mayamaea pseudoterrestris]
MSKRLLKERSKLETSPIEYVANIELVNEDLFKWDVTIKGPADSPYDGGRFILRMDFPAEYPFKAPRLAFMTKVYHPSVLRESGEICGAVLGAWGPTLDVKHVLMTVYSLLKDPQADHPLDDEIAEQLSKKPKEFEKMAKKYTKDYAK